MPSKSPDKAIAKTHQLPEQHEKRLGSESNDDIDHLRALRSDISAGIRSLGAGLGRRLDIEDTIARAHATHSDA